MEINKLILDLPLYKIICFEGYEKNKEILENAKPINEVKEKIQQDTLPNEEFSLIEKKETIVSRFLNWIKRLLNKKG